MVLGIGISALAAGHFVGEPIRGSDRIRVGAFVVRAGGLRFPAEGSRLRRLVPTLPLCGFNGDCHQDRAHKEQGQKQRKAFFHLKTSIYSYFHTTYFTE